MSALVILSYVFYPDRQGRAHELQVLWPSIGSKSFTRPFHPGTAFENMSNFAYTRDGRPATTVYVEGPHFVIDTFICPIDGAVGGYVVEYCDGELVSTLDNHNVSDTSEDGRQLMAELAWGVGMQQAAVNQASSQSSLDNTMSMNEIASVIGNAALTSAEDVNNELEVERWHRGRSWAVQLGDCHVQRNSTGDCWYVDD